MTLKTIPFEDLTNDFFVNEVKPESRKPDGRVKFSATGKKASTLAIIEEQVLPVVNFVQVRDWDGAVAHAVEVCKQMKGFQGFANKPVTKESIAKHVKAQVQIAGATFDSAIQNVIAGTRADGHGQLTSAASKMLQLFPHFANDSVVYDSVVRQAIVNFGLAGSEREVKGIVEYLSAVRNLIARPVIELANGSTVSVDDYLMLPQIKSMLATHAWVTEHDLVRFVRSRLFDRALWLMAAETKEEKELRKAA